MFQFLFFFFFWLEEVRVSGYIRQPVGAKKGASLDAEVSTWRFEISELDYLYISWTFEMELN